MHQVNQRLKVARVNIEGEVLSELCAIRKSLSELSGGITKGYIKAARAIGIVEQALRRPVRLAVLGEENSGKSLLLNYLLKHQILPSKQFSAEETGILIRYSAEPSVYTVSKEGHRNRLTSRAFGTLSKAEARPHPKSSSIIYQASDHSSRRGISSRSGSPVVLTKRKTLKPPSRLIDVGLPLGLLRTLEMIEVRNLPEDKTVTPATIAFRQVDIAIWCTLATQAWKETEAISWRRIPLAHRQSSLLLVTYKDAIQDTRDEVKILERLHRATPTMFNDILLVSPKDAVASLLPDEAENGNALRASSNIEAVEHALLCLVRNQQVHRLHKANRLLRSIAASLARMENQDADASQRQRVITDKLYHVADDIMNVPPSASLAFEAA